MARLHSFSALCPLALVLLLIPSAADAQQRTYRSAQQPPRHGQPTERADQPSEQPHQLELPKRRAPRLGGPIVAMSIGGLLLFGAVYVAALDLDSDSGGFQIGLGVSLGATALLQLAVAGAVFGRRMEQRVRYGFAPVIHPERSLYGFQGMVSF